MTPGLARVCLLAWLVATSACVGRSADADRDGLADDLEQTLAKDLFPVLHVSPGDACPEPLSPKPVLFRARHPQFRGVRDHEYVVINYVVLYDADCGDGAHRGDNEPMAVFARRSGEGGYLFESMAATAHTNTAAEVRTNSTHRDIWIEANKHANFAPSAGCRNCPLAGPSWDAALFNVGEPEAPLLSDLGAVRPAYKGINPWSTVERFFGAGIIGAESLGLRWFDYLTHPPAAPGGRWDD